jgi:uncharacterized protein with HEPN domain
LHLWKLTNSGGCATSSILIASYVKDTAEPDFGSDTQKQDAIIRRIEIIGEAAVHLTEETRQAIPELPFRKMRGMRNIVAHDYANVDLRVVWDVAAVHVPEVCAVLEKFFAGPGQVPGTPAE